LFPIKYRPIGIVHSPYIKQEGTPIQTVASKGAKGVIEIFPEYKEGLKDMENFSHIYILFHFHLSSQKPLTVIPFLDMKHHGVFATRSPARPNAIGLSVVCLEKIIENKLYIKNVDMLEGTPVLDIKPYISDFDIFKTTKNGWVGDKMDNLEDQKDDGRFK
jgi:tRNA-Thr(GGU) m(6)t(6)A37 methyltransferase TsaA